MEWLGGTIPKGIRLNVGGLSAQRLQNEPLSSGRLARFEYRSFSDWQSVHRPSASVACYWNTSVPVLPRATPAVVLLGSVVLGLDVVENDAARGVQRRSTLRAG
jgi:hypothetical protein